MAGSRYTGRHETLCGHDCVRGNDVKPLEAQDVIRSIELYDTQNIGPEEILTPITIHL